MLGYWKTLQHEGDGDTSYYRRVQYSHKKLVQGLENSEIRGQLDTIQSTALLRLAKILRRVLEIKGNFLSLKLL